jgi:hypothetical protein
MVPSETAEGAARNGCALKASVSITTELFSKLYGSAQIESVCGPDNESWPYSQMSDMRALAVLAEHVKAIEKGGSEVLMDRRQEPRTLWETTVDRWLHAGFSDLAGHARRLGQGDRGVLVVAVDTVEMERMLETSPLGAVDPKWFPVDVFTEMIQRPEPKGRGLETARRWAEAIRMMDPARDVALFVTSKPNSEGHWFSRFLIMHDGNVEVH